MKRLLALLACAALSTGIVRAEEPGETVVFVCEHGSVKSVMASELFNRAASERRLPFRSVSRGIVPDDRVPDRIVERLREDGFDAASFRPQAVTADDVADAARVIAIGIDTGKLPPATDAEQWNDVPAASADYAAARQNLQQHINALLDELARGAAARDPT